MNVRAQFQQPADNGPINTEAEMIVLASALADNRGYAAYAERISASDFAHPLHQQMHEAVVKKIGANKRAEVSTILSDLTAAPPVGESLDAYLKALPGLARPADELEAFVEVVRNFADARKIRSVCAKFDGLAQRGGNGLVEQLSEEISTLTAPSGHGTISWIGDGIGDYLEQLRRGGPEKGFSTSLKKVDSYLTLRRGTLTTIAAHTKQGKTALACQMLRNLAKAGKRGFFASIEMPKSEILERLIALESKVPVRDFKFGFNTLSEAQKDAVADAVRAIEKWPMRIDEETNLTPAMLAIRARNAVKVDGCEAVFIDYIQKMKTENDRRSKYEQVTEISSAIADLRKTLDIPVVALAQFRKPDDREAKNFKNFKVEHHRPHITDLRDSGTIAQDCDHLLLLYRPDFVLLGMKPWGDPFSETVMEWETAVSAIRGQAEIQVALNRSGPTGIANVHFQEAIGAFGDEVSDFGDRR